MLRKSLMVLLAAALLALPAAAQGEEMTLEQVLAKNIEAKGGRERIDSVETIRATGTMTMGPGMEVPFVAELKRPNKMRIEFTVQGMTGIQAFDGETGWFVMPFMGKTEPEKMSEEQLKTMRDDADIDGPLIDWAKKGHKLELMGKEDIEGTPAWKLKLTKKNGDVDYYYLDAEYFLEIKMEGKREMQGVETEIAVTFGDYKEVDGMMVPHSQQIQPQGSPMAMTRTVKTMEINPGVADDRFTMPASETASAGN